MAHKVNVSPTAAGVEGEKKGGELFSPAIPPPFFFFFFPIMQDGEEKRANIHSDEGKQRLLCTAVHTVYLSFI